MFIDTPRDSVAGGASMGPTRESSDVIDRQLITELGEILITEAGESLKWQGNVGQWLVIGLGLVFLI